MEEREAVRVFKALGDEKRLRILLLLRQGERCACVLLEHLNLSQPTLSHHMKILCDAQLVTGRKEGSGSIIPSTAPRPRSWNRPFTTYSSPVPCRQRTKPAAASEAGPFFSLYIDKCKYINFYLGGLSS